MASVYAIPILAGPLKVIQNSISTRVTLGQFSAIFSFYVGNEDVGDGSHVRRDELLKHRRQGVWTP